MTKETKEELIKDCRKIVVEALGIFFGAYLSFMFIPGNPILKTTTQEATVSNRGLLPANATLHVVSEDESVALSLQTSSPYAQIISRDNEAFVNIHDLPRGQIVPLTAKTPMTVNVIGSDTATTAGFSSSSYKPNSSKNYFEADMTTPDNSWFRSRSKNTKAD